jgi:hypothetical protein
LIAGVVVAGVFAHRALAAIAVTYSNPHSNIVGSATCYETSQYCTIYPSSGVVTPNFTYRNWTDSSWEFPPWSNGALNYIDTGGNWPAAITTSDETYPYLHLGVQMDNVKAECRNATNNTATNNFQCSTTEPG